MEPFETYSPPMENKKFQSMARIMLSMILIILGGYTIFNFLPSLVWAGIFVIATWPLYKRCETRFPLGKHNIFLPLVFTFLVAMIFLIPLGIVAIKIGKETNFVIDWVKEAKANGIPFPIILNSIPIVGQHITQWWTDNLADRTAINSILEHIDKNSAMLFSRNIGAQITRRIAGFALTIITLFFLYRSGHQIGNQLLIASHKMFGYSGERVGKQIIASVHGTVDGLVLVGVAEGVIMGISYAIAGAPHPTLLAAFTAISAMLPFVAPVAVALASLLLLSQGAVVAAIIILIFGMIVILIADHAIRPILIGGATKLPFLWVLLGILGGIETWGLLGLFVGPALMSALILLWREWVTSPSQTLT